MGKADKRVKEERRGKRKMKKEEKEGERKIKEKKC